MSADKCQKASKKEILASEYSSEQVLSVHTSSFYILLPFAIKVIDLTPQILASTIMLEKRGLSLGEDDNDRGLFYRAVLLNHDLF